MTWDLAGDRPIWLQLTEQIRLRIVAGEYRAGERLPSVRELAAQAAVNPNTMQKALTELERSGLVYSQRTSGRFITRDEGMILALKQQLAREQTAAFLARMANLGFSGEETLGIMRAQVEKGSEGGKDGT